ncbi:MAG TPA: DUF1330 domain-containing protein [Reyranella sp.]|nr:DUF1330 domain-containing protein [Reyranella sp.]
MALVAGATIGMAAGASPMAQKKAQAYYIAEVAVADVEADKRVLARYPGTAESFGGRYLVRGGKSVIYAGEPPRRLVLVAFDNLEAVDVWRNSSQVRQFEAERKTVGSNILRAFAIEGLPQQ